jgi:hypothetical protein
VCSERGALSLGRQLQYARLLAVQEYDLAAREFQRVAVTYRVLFVDLSKDRCPVFDYALSGWQGGPTLISSANDNGRQAALGRDS